MDRQPVLEGERLTLRPLAPDDREALYAIASDPAVWEQHPIHDRWREDVFDAFFDEAIVRGGALAVVEPRDNSIIGSSRFDNLLTEEDDPEEQTSVEIGWTFLAPRYWGKGVNHEMKRLMLTHAFRFVDRVDFRVGETNWRSRTALENIGAERTRRTELSQYQGKRVIHIVYAITRNSFEQGPLSHT